VVWGGVARERERERRLGAKERFLPLRRPTRHQVGAQPTRRFGEGAARPQSLHIQTVGEARDPTTSRQNHLYKTPPTDSSHPRSALLGLLHAAWEPLRYAALYHAALTGQDNPRLVPLASMRATSSLYR
jgi:hypothetical protein